jgi:hypothetical protein
VVSISGEEKKLRIGKNSRKKRDSGYDQKFRSENR